MNNNRSRLELLPNEILIGIFEYFDARNLFRAFYNLNFRFNRLLRSLNHLCYIIPTPDPDESIDVEIFSSSIYTLISKCNLDYQFCHFTNVHRLILNRFPNNALKNFNVDNLPHLEHLSVRIPIGLMQCPDDFHQKSLSNGFPYLKSSSYPNGLIAKQETKNWTQSPSLGVLHVGIMEFSVYKIILASCPNLYFLSFSPCPWDDITYHIEPHMHLKRLIVKITLDGFSHDNRINDYLVCVPNLEQLTIHQYLNKSIIRKSFLKCDWFASMIACHLPVLRRFNLYILLALRYRTNKVNLQTIRSQIEKNFKHMHSHRYQSRIIISC